MINFRQGISVDQDTGTGARGAPRGHERPRPVRHHLRRGGAGEREELARQAPAAEEAPVAVVFPRGVGPPETHG